MPAAPPEILPVGGDAPPQKSQVYLEIVAFCAKVSGIPDKKYVQVCYLLSDESVVEREFGNLEQIGDFFEKMVVSLDDMNLGNRNGIIHRSAWEFVD